MADRNEILELVRIHGWKRIQYRLEYRRADVGAWMQIDNPAREQEAMYALFTGHTPEHKHPIEFMLHPATCTINGIDLDDTRIFTWAQAEEAIAQHGELFIESPSLESGVERYTSIQYIRKDDYLLTRGIMHQTREGAIAFMLARHAN